MPKVYSYVRFSTPEQAAGTSLERQTEAARVFAAGRGLEFDQELSYVDAGVSAYTGEHAKSGRLGEFLELTKAGAVERGSVLVIEALDRLSRQETRVARDLFESILDAGCAIYTTIDGHLYEPGKYDLMEMITTLIRIEGAHQASAQKAQRVKQAWKIRREQARESGRIITPRCPAWLRIVGRKVEGKRVVEPGRFEVMEDRAALVRQVFEHAARGYSLTRLAREMNDDGVPTFGRGKGGKAALWRPHVLRKIVTNRAVLGEFIPRRWERTETGAMRRVEAGEPAIQGYFPAILSQELFDAAQVGSSGRGIHAAQGTPVRNLLARVGRCGGCGGSVGLKTYGPHAPRRLLCRNSRAKSTACPLGRPTVRLDVVDDALVRAAPTIAQVGAGNTDVLRKVAEAQAYAWQLEDDIDTLLTLASGKGRLTRTQERLETLERELEGARRAVRDLEREAAEQSGPVVQHRLRALAQELQRPELDRDACNAAIRAAVDRVVVDYAAERLVLEWRHGGETVVPWGSEFEAQG